MADCQRLEPGLFDLDFAVLNTQRQIAAPIRIDAGGEHQFAMVDRESALLGAVLIAMAVPVGRPETGDPPLRDVFHVLVLALQDHRDFGVESAHRDCRRNGWRRCRHLSGSDFGLGSGLFGVDQADLERCDALFVGFLHLFELGTDLCQIGVVGSLDRGGKAEHRSHGGKGGTHDDSSSKH
jgi:hypothetical protein